MIAKGNSGVAMTEFALAAPVFLVLGVQGLDTANYVITHMRVSQIAVHVADNASRVGENNVLVSRKVYEDDINDLLIGAQVYGSGLDLSTNGRLIISSLEVNDDGGQWIHWQRCMGDLEHVSGYGEAGDGEDGTDFPGMGRAGAEITATSGTAVMFAEVAYRYEPLSPMSLHGNSIITYTSAFNVRDSRDLTRVYQTTPSSPVASCQ